MIVTTLLTKSVSVCVCLPLYSTLKTMSHWNAGKDDRLLTQQNYKMLMRRTIMTMTTITTTTAMKITTLTTTTTTIKQQRKADASLFA